MSAWLVAAQAAMAFNLVCSGTSAIRDGKDGEVKAAPYHAVLRVDLPRRRYCLDACRETFPLVAVTPGQIVLQDGPIFGGTIHHTVDRKTGRYALHVITNLGPRGFENTSTGTCERAPFAGFPQHETRSDRRRD